MPEYDRLEIRRADSLQGLRAAEPVVVWRKPKTGQMSELIWAPEMHRINGKWYLYFAAAHTQALDKLNMFQHRMFALECADADPLTGVWTEKGQVKTPFDTFALDATTFHHQGKQWYLWAQKAPDIAGNSNIYLAELENPWTLKGEPVRLSKPEYDWECRAFGLTKALQYWYTAINCLSATPPAPPMKTIVWACCGLICAPIRAIRQNWHKLPRPVFTTSIENRQFGPGHNSFTTTPDGEDVLVYHARNYTEIAGDPLYDPNRHTRLKRIRWDENGMPDFGIPPADTL
ncbi:glycosyl hydrolase [Salmonella enterica subsp. arizonae]|uniref:Glycosyl hydrolase n=1 Tax=Salmonella enterica subsp. arizonae TaxID=59203 RepID=A0A379S7G5_SALER|nr:glycosyl hydrolase [Salmonella enterica subsp. arizonae]